MKTFQLDNVKYQIPEKWSEVTLRQQIKVSKDAEQIADESLKRIALLSGYANIPMDILKRTELRKIKNLFKYLSFINQPLPEHPIQEFEFKGHKYSVIDTIINQQFQDFISIETAMDNFKDDPMKALPVILAIYAKRDGETLDDYDLNERAKEFEELPMTVVQPLKVFFSQIGKVSKIATLLSSHGKEVVDAKVIEFENTLNKQVGGGLRMRLLIGGMKLWIKSLKKSVTSYFNSTQ